jgi:hypothetical protein
MPNIFACMAVAPLEVSVEAAEAIGYSEQGHARGKVVIRLE